MRGVLRSAARMVSDPVSIDPLLVLCIPGAWDKREQLVEGVAARSSGRFRIVGGTLRDEERRQTFAIEVRESDARMARAFLASGLSDRQTFATIETHRLVVYLKQPVRAEGDAPQTFAAASALLDCGGLGVKVESAGVAHTPERWRELAEIPAVSPRKAFVQIVAGDAEVYSCGMHLLRLPEGVVAQPAAVEDSIPTLLAFRDYLVFESPDLRDGQGFRPIAGGPRYLLRHLRDERYATDACGSIRSASGGSSRTPTEKARCASA